MPGVFMDPGLAPALDNVRLGILVGAKVHLYSNNHTPGTSDTLGSYTEATFPGYASATASGWTASSTTSHVAKTTANPVTFTLTSGSQNIYGYYITDSGGTLLYAAEIDPNAPIAMNTTTNTYQVTPTIQLQSA